MDNTNTGNLISFLRKEKGLTQAELGEKIGVSSKAVSKWERGICMPDINKLNLVCKELNITVSELINGKRNSKLDEQDINYTTEKCISLCQSQYKKSIKKNFGNYDFSIFNYNINFNIFIYAKYI